MRFLLTILVITALAVFGLVSGCSVLDRFGGRDAADSAASSGADLRVIDSSSSGSDMSYVSDQTSFIAAAPAAGSASTQDRKSTRLNSSHSQQSRMPSSA